MATFAYKARNKSGGLIEGNQDGDTPADCARALMGKGLTPISIVAASKTADKSAGKAAPQKAEKKAAASRSSLIKQPKMNTSKPDLDDLMFFCRQMYTLTRSGVPLVRGISGLADSTRNKELADALRQVTRDLEAGTGLAQSIQQQGELFPPLMMGILRVGESSGRVDESFLQLSGYLERERDTQARIKSAMRYPTMVVMAITAAMVVINIFVIPSFASMFAGFKTELPLATRILLATSNFTIHYWPVILVIVAVIAVAWRKFVKTDKGRLWWDRVKLSVPVIGPVLTKTSLARFARSFAMMMKSGVPITQSLNLLIVAVDNAYMGTLFTELRRAIERGESISRTAATLGIFTPLILQMIDVGEETGRLDDMLTEVADYYDHEVDVDLKNMSSAIEPILLVVIGGMVLVLAMGVFLPIWEMGKAMK